MTKLLTKSLLANLELVQIRHPEQRSDCIFLRTWVQLQLNGRVDASKALSSSWLNSLRVLTGLPCEELLRPISIPSRTAAALGGFGFFEDEDIFFLTDGQQNVALSQIETMHPCIGVLNLKVENNNEVYYLINGTYWVGLNPRVPLSEFRSLLLLRVKTETQMSTIIPMQIRSLRFTKEVAHADA